MPAFTFEKIPPPAKRGAVAPIVKTQSNKHFRTQRGLIVQILDRFVELRTKRSLPAAHSVNGPKKSKTSD